MTRKPPRLAAAALLMITFLAGETVHAQKPGGVLQVAHRDSPASMSPLEEVTISTVAPMMAVFNNLVMFDQHVPQNTLPSIVPDLATGWSWNEDGTELTFRLREGVRWHDGHPFTAKDVIGFLQCDGEASRTTGLHGPAVPVRSTLARLLAMGMRHGRNPSRDLPITNQRDQVGEIIIAQRPDSEPRGFDDDAGRSG